MIERAYLSVGTNMGDRLANLQQALDLLSRQPAIRLVRVSPVYETEPVGPVVQQSFYNIGLALETTLTAPELLDWCHVVEQSLHRRRLIHWGPRTIDLDIVFYGQRHYDWPRLQVPHPEASNRRFVIVPLLAVSADDSATHQRLTAMLNSTTDTNWLHQLAQGVTINGSKSN